MDAKTLQVVWFQRFLDRLGDATMPYFPAFAVGSSALPQARYW